MKGSCLKMNGINFETDNNKKKKLNFDHYSKLTYSVQLSGK